ncbi:hypothetical protein [Nostoc sp.]
MVLSRRLDSNRSFSGFSSLSSADIKAFQIFEQSLETELQQVKTHKSQI